MGVYFKDMRMPENCFRCPAHEWYDFGGKDHGYKCAAMVVGNPQYGKVISNCDARRRRMEHCPAVPVDDHGDLIDREKAVANMCLDESLDIVARTKIINEYIANALEEQPVVIPAEGRVAV